MGGCQWDCDNASGLCVSGTLPLPPHTHTQLQIQIQIQTHQPSCIISHRVPCGGAKLTLMCLRPQPSPSANEDEDGAVTRLDDARFAKLAQSRLTTTDADPADDAELLSPSQGASDMFASQMSTTSTSAQVVATPLAASQASSTETPGGGLV